MTTLVTAASGHLGAHVVRHLLAQGRTVRAVVRQTSNPRGAELSARLRGKPLGLMRARAHSLVGQYAFYDASKAQRELGYTARPARDIVTDAVQWVRTQGCA